MANASVQREIRTMKLTKEMILSNVRLCVQPKSEEEFLKGEFCGDLEVYYRVFLPDGSFKVTDEIIDSTPDLNRMEVSIAALKNTRERAQVFALNSMFLPVEPDDFSSGPIVVKNAEMQFGAGAILCTDLLHEVAEKTGAKRLFILPSSIHEILLMPDDGIIAREELDTMVKAVNQTELLPEEILSDHTYIYDDSTRTVRG